MPYPIVVKTKGLKRGLELIEESIGSESWGTAGSTWTFLYVRIIYRCCTLLGIFGASSTRNQCEVTNQKVTAGIFSIHPALLVGG